MDGSGGGTNGNEQLPQWKTYLYQLQKEAPHPRRIICHREIPNKPYFYGKEYHGHISREDTDRLLDDKDGSYLVRKSDRAPEAFTLAIRFDGQTKNFKLYHDGQHYVGEKRFDTIHDLVADGLITFYLESRAADYIESLSISNYAESPYLAYSTKKKRLARSTTRRSSTGTNNQVSTTSNCSVDNNSSDEQLSPDSDFATNVQEYEKSHCFKVQNFIGLHWCDYCANFMWGLIAQGVKCQDCGFEAHKKCSERVPNDCMPDMKYVKRLFGADLTTVVKAQNTPIPIVVEKCIKEIEHRGVDFEGVYRVAGFHDDIEAVRMEFDRDGENTDISESRLEDVNTLTSVLKLYFRLLPIPLISFESYPKLLEAVQKPGLKEKEKLQMIKEALHLLQPAHYQTLKYLMAHLDRVIEQQSKNMMSPENLAIVFAPTLMRSPDATASLMAVKLEQTVTELILSNQKELLR
ncbi:N-chimaerin-like isoform X2 [Argonauta hians]